MDDLLTPEQLSRIYRILQGNKMVYTHARYKPDRIVVGYNITLHAPDLWEDEDIDDAHDKLSIAVQDALQEFMDKHLQDDAGYPEITVTVVKTSVP